MPNNNININGDITGVGIVTGATVNQLFNTHQYIIPSQLSIKLGKSTIVGREKELTDIDNLLYNSSPLLLIHGIGGVGKSILASYYLHTQKENLDYYGFFEGLDSFVNELRHPLNLKSEKYQDAFIEALLKLSSLEGKKLLIFDDVRDIEENQEIIDKILSLTHSGYKIIFTSREEIEHIVSYHLNPFSIDNAKEFFNSIYSIVEDDEKLLEEILSYIDYHPLFIELTAKTLLNRKNLTLQEIKEKFENGEFSRIKIKRRESFKQYLSQLFNLDKLDDEEILMLKQFSVLPSIEIDFNSLEEIFNKKDYEEFEDILIYLCEKGWLSSFKNGYKLHQIIKEYILSTYSPTFKEIEVIVDFFIELMGDTGDKKIAISHENNIIYFESLAKVFELIEVENEKVVEFFNSLGLLYQTLGENDKIESCYLKALTISQKKLGENNLSTAVSANNLAGLYWFQGGYKKAESLYTRALKLTEHILGENHPYTVTNYNNLAGLYLSMKDYDKAEPLYLKALKKSEEILEKNHPSITIIHQNINALKQKQNKFFFLNSQSSNLTFKIDNIEIENFKQYSKFTIEFSKSINIIVGQNSVGKTSLLQAITLALLKKDSSDEKTNYTNYINYNSDTSKFTVSYNGQKKIVYLLKEKRMIENNYFIPFVLAYGSNFFTKYNLDSDEIVEKILNGTINKNFAHTIFLDYIDEFWNPLSILNELDKSDHHKAKEKKDIIFETINSFLKEYKLEKKEEKYFFQKGDDKTKLYLEDLSEGYRGNVLLITDMLIKILGVGWTPKTIEGIILIDEFDKHLHPRWQSKLVNQLTETFPKIQFIMTTHNPMSILGRNPDEITKLVETNGKIEAVRGRGTQTVDVSIVLLEYFNVDSTISDTMKNHVNNFNKLKLKKELTSKEEAELKELKKFLGETIASNFIYDRKYLKFLEFIRDHKDIDFDRYDEMTGEEMDEILKDFGDFFDD